MSFTKRTWEKRSRYWDRLNNIEDALANGGSNLLIVPFTVNSDSTYTTDMTLTEVSEALADGCYAVALVDVTSSANEISNGYFRLTNYYKSADGTHIFIRFQQTETDFGTGFTRSLEWDLTDTVESITVTNYVFAITED